MWERPEDLVGRPDVDKAVSTIPEQLRNADSPVKIAEQVSEGTSVDSGKKDNHQEKDMDGNDTNEEEEVPAKKTKIEGKVHCVIHVIKSIKNNFFLCRSVVWKGSK